MQCDPLSFEAILRERIETLSHLESEPSTIRYSMTKQGEDFSGILLVESSRGKFFATAVENNIELLNQSLIKQIMRFGSHVPRKPYLIHNAH